MKAWNRSRFSVTSVAVSAVLLAIGAGPALAATEIHVLSNRADWVTDGDVLVEVTPVPPGGTIVDLGGSNVTSDFALRPNGRYMGIVSGLATGANLLTVMLPDTSGASITIDNHPPEGPVFNGPHLRWWDCTTEREGLGPPDDPTKCNAPPAVEYFYLSATSGNYETYDPESPPLPEEIENTTTDQSVTVPHIVRHEKGAYARGIYAFAVLHDPADPLSPWEPPAGWNGKLYYPFGASCNTNYTQGSTPGVLNQTRLGQGFAMAMNSLNTLGHHCSTWLSAESAMMVKERLIEVMGRPRFTISTGGSGGAIGQNMVSNMYPGITNGLITDLVYPDSPTTGIEVFDCFALQGYWPTAGVPFTTLQRAAVDGKGPINTTCASWAATFAPAGNPSTGCFGEQTLPALNIPFFDPDRDYNPVTNPDGCRASAQEILVNQLGRRGFDGFAKGMSENIGVQYGLNALNLPVGDPGKITFAQFLDMNAKIGGFTIDGVKKADRSRPHEDATEILYRSGGVNDGSGLVHNPIINLPAELNAEFHTPAHSYALKQRLIETNGHSDNFALWHHGTKELAWTTMNEWLEAIFAAGGIDPVTGIMHPATIVSVKPAIAVDTCWDGNTALPLDDPLCAADVYTHPRVEAGMPFTHDVPECALKDIDPDDYSGAVPPLTLVDLAALETIFPDGVCDWSVKSPKHTGNVQWLSYENGPGGEEMGPPPISTPF